MGSCKENDTYDNEMRNLVGVAPEVTCGDSRHLNSGMGPYFPFDHVYNGLHTLHTSSRDFL